MHAQLMLPQTHHCNEIFILRYVCDRIFRRYVHIKVYFFAVGIVDTVINIRISCALASLAAFNRPNFFIASFFLFD
jgi:hypothetical protein